MDIDSGEVTRLLERASGGDEDAADRLWNVVHHELRRLAAVVVARERPSADLQATVVVQEVYLRLHRDVIEGEGWTDRTAFFGRAWRVMRQILVDRARHRARVKRGGGRRSSSLEVLPNELGSLDPVGDDTELLLQSLDELASREPRQHEVVWRRFALGQTVEEVAESMGLSPRTIASDWRLGSARLRRSLAAEEGGTR